MTRARHGRFARLLSVVASVALVGPLLALSSPGAHAEELAPTPPAVVETTSVPEPDPAAESGAPLTQAPDPAPAPETTPATEPTEDPAPIGEPAPDGDAGAPAPELEPAIGPAAAPVPAAAEDGTGSISGTVTNEEGEPVANAWLVVYRDGDAPVTSWTSWTDGDGTYTIANLPAGSGYLVTLAPPEGSTYFPRSWEDVSVTAGEPTVLDVVLEAANTITGRVVNAEGDGPAEINIDLIREGEGYSSYGAATEQDGAFTFDSVPAGRYTVRFSDDSWPRRYRDQWWDGASSLDEATYFDLSGGVTVDLDEIELAVVPTASGRVLGADSNPLADVRVYLYESWAEDEWDYSDSASTDEDGNYTFGDLEPGASYKLRFRAYGNEYRDQWYQGRADFATADRLTIGDGPNQVPDVQLVKGAKIQGRITFGGSANGQPLVNEEIRLYAWDDQAGNEELASEWTDDDGMYSLNRLVPGEYYLLVSYGALTHRTTKIEIPEDAGSEPAVVTLDITVSPGASLAGTIELNGTPVPNVEVYAWSKTGRVVSSGWTNDAGEYLVRALGAGSHTISVHGDDLPNRYLGGVTTLRSADWLKLTAQEARTGVDLDLGGGGVVRGRVTGQGGAGVANTEVVLVAKNGITRTRVSTDQDGFYTMAGVPAGVYALRVKGNDNYLYQWWNGPQGDDGEYYDDYYVGRGDIYFSVLDGRTETKDVVLAAYGRITGTIDLTNTGENEYLEVRITAYRRDASGLREITSDWKEWNGAAESFDLTGISPGEYLVRASVDGRVYWYPNVLNAAGATPVVVRGNTATVTMVADYAKQATGGFSGTLVAPGVQLDQARVTAFSEEDGEFDRSVDVDSSGAFSFAHLPAGKYRLRVGAMTGYAATYYPSALSSEQATVVTVGDAMVPLGNWSPVAAPGSVTGRVFAANGTDPVTGTGWVELERVSGDDSWYVGETRIENGGYAFAGGLVPGQRYRLYGWVGEASGGSAEFTATQSGTVVDLVLLSDVEVEHERATIEGIVSDGEEFVPGVDAVAIDADGNREDALTSRADGSYALDRLRPGTYKVRFGDYSSTQSYYAPAWLGGPTERTAEQVTLTEGQVVTGKNVTLTRAGRISGTVASSSGGVTTWLGAAPASLYTAGGVLLDTMESGWYSPGGFGFTVPAGSYKICAQQSWSGTSTSNCWSTGGGLVPLANASTITVAGGQDVNDIDLLFRTVQSLTTAKPTISGLVQVGQKLTASPGAWGPEPVTKTYQWLRDGVTIAGATSAVYTVTVADVGKRLSATVTGSKPGYTTASQTSLATAVVPALALTATPTPTVSGTAKVGSRLAVSAGTWAPATVSLVYQWLRDGAAIPGATAATYVLVGEDAGRTIAVRVTGSKLGYTTVAKTSKATAKVAFGTLTSATPKISGTAKVGATLTVSVGAWKPAPVTFRYQWLANGKAIKTAKSAATYVLTAAEKGKTITVKVTGSKTGYTTVATTSAKTKKVAVGTLKAPVPKIAGTAKVGRKLTATAGSWGPAPVKLKYQWYRSGKKISKATKATYTLVSADKGKTITVKVTGSKTGFTTATKTSKKTGKVSS